MRRFIAKAGVVSLMLVPLSFVACKGKPQTVITTEKPDVLCPICGMKLNPEDSQWRTEIKLKNGVTFQFHTPKHAFLYYLNIQEYSAGKYRTADVDSFLAHDYFSKDLISAFTAHYLVGSRINSPMGADIIPMPPDSVSKYVSLYGGRYARFSDIDKKTVLDLQKPPTGEVQTEAKTAIDPVCGMTVATASAKSQSLVAQYQGKTYYFCVAQDRDAFIKNPTPFIK